MNDVKDALTRKLGPLPAWVWALVGGVALYWYRNRTANTTATSTTGQTVDSTAGLRDPVTLAAGESLYDPNTGQMIGTAPEQQPPQPPQPQTTLEPGEALYDPNTGQLIEQPVAASPTTTAAKKAAEKKKKEPSTKHLLSELKKGHSPGHTRRIKKILRDRHVKIPRGAKPSTKHGQQHGTAVPHPGTTSGQNKGRPRSHSTVRHPTKQHATHTPPRHTARARSVTPPGPPPPPPRRLPPRPAPVVRQHPAPKRPMQKRHG